MEIIELITEEEWKQAYPVIKQLRVHLDETEYLQLVGQAQKESGYKLVGLFDSQVVKAVIGFMPMITLYNGHFIWICDLVTDKYERSKGYGKKLLDYVHNWAKEQGYSIVSLSSGLQRKDAHRFYQEKMEYDAVSYVFLKKLK